MLVIAQAIAKSSFCNAHVKLVLDTGMWVTGYELSTRTDERQTWTNYENNGNEYLIIGDIVRSKYSNIQYQHLIIGNVENFVWSHKNDFQEYKSRLHCKQEFAIFYPIIK